MTTKREHEEQTAFPVATGSSLMMDRNKPREVMDRSPRAPFLDVKVKPSTMIWSMLVQCKGVEDQAAIKGTVESLNRLG